MMPAKICSGAAIAWASCSCAAGCTTAAATGRRAIGGGSTAWSGPSLPERVVVDDYLLAIDQLEARLIELDARLADIAADGAVS